MKKIVKIVFLLSVITISTMVITGCKKDWLEPKPLSMYVPENTLVDVQGFRSALSSISNNVKPEWYGDASPNITEQVFSEESVEGTDDKTGPAQDLNQLIRPDAQLNHTDFNKIGYFWDRQYVSIRAANVIVTRIAAEAAAGIAEADKNIILGQAYFFRAYSYYRLVHQFGDVPCPMKEVTSPKTDFYSVKREVILTRMKQDMEFAVKYVPWTTDKGDINRAACYHLLTKINLALGLFDDAITSASAVISQGSYKLMTARFGVDAGIASKNVTWDLHRPDNKAAAANTEVLYLVTDRFGTAGAFAGGAQSMRNAVPFVSAGTNLTPSKKVGMSASQGIEIDVMKDYGRGIGRCRSTPYYYKDIWAGNTTDHRHDSVSGNWVYMENLRYSNPALKGTDTAYGLRMRLYGPTGDLLCQDTLRNWYPWPHYKLYVVDPINNPYRGGNTDWYVFRLAETYLLRAEAYLWKGDKASAVADINAIRTRANAPGLSAATVTMSDLLDERARELYYEEPRKTELTRIAYIYAKTGLPSYTGKTYTVANFSTSNFMVDRILEKNIFYAKNFVTVHADVFRISQYHVLWPIPQGAILANTDGKINQNIGYTGASSNVPPLDKIPE